jgi:hypothetical protein
MKMSLTQIDNNMIIRNLENTKSKAELKEFDFPAGARLQSRKPIRLKADSFEMLTKTVAGENSKFSELTEQGYDNNFASAVQETFEENSPAIEPISLDETTLKDLGEPATIETEPEMVNIENNELPDIAGIISDSENEEKVDEERNEYETEETIERIKPPVQPVRSFSDFQEENTQSFEPENVQSFEPENFEEERNVKPIDAESIFKEIERKSEEERKELETPETTSNLSFEEENVEESYENRVARLKREIEEKRRQLSEQRRINETTTGTIESQRRIFEAAQKSAAELEERNRQIEADNIAQLESLFRETEAEYKDELTTGQSLEGELTKAEEDATLASSRVEELQAINESLMKSSNEIVEMVSTEGTKGRYVA